MSAFRSASGFFLMFTTSAGIPCSSCSLLTTSLRPAPYLPLMNLIIQTSLRCSATSWLQRERDLLSDAGADAVEEFALPAVGEAGFPALQSSMSWAYSSIQVLGLLFSACGCAFIGSSFCLRRTRFGSK